MGYFAGSVSLRSVTEKSLTDAIEHLLRQSVDGIVMIAAQYEALDVIRRHDSGVPLVVVEGDLWKVGALRRRSRPHRGASTGHRI